jgi:hypothetical protein
MIELPVETILNADISADAALGQTIGNSREGRPIEAFVFGRGPRSLSLIGGCHADEPVGPAMLRRLVRVLPTLDPGHRLLEDFSWFVVPQVNPDGEQRNAAWIEQKLATIDHLGASDTGYDPVVYVQNVVRELPGDDIEFGFPRGPDDRQVRPENRAVADFLFSAANLALHASLHGMGFAPGPWFLIEPAWIERTTAMRQAVRNRVREMRYPLFDIDRQGEKGFRRIDEGFSTRPDSRAMVKHFLSLGDADTAARFRPSSMELARSLGGDPLTLVSEMPLFLLAENQDNSGAPGFKAGTPGRRQLHDRLRRLAAEVPTGQSRQELARLGIRPMPIRDQMRLQLAFLSLALGCIAAR